MRMTNRWPDNSMIGVMTRHRRPVRWNNMKKNINIQCAQVQQTSSIWRARCAVRLIRRMNIHDALHSPKKCSERKTIAGAIVLIECSSSVIHIGETKCSPIKLELNAQNYVVKRHRHRLSFKQIRSFSLIFVCDSSIFGRNDLFSSLLSIKMCAVIGRI